MTVASSTNLGFGADENVLVVALLVLLVVTMAVAQVSAARREHE
jgi:hypothetical protein